MMISSRDISSAFRPSVKDSAIAETLIKLEGTPRAIEYFATKCDQLTDYSYWFFLGTLWVSYTGWSDLQLWRRLFACKRPSRAVSLMKPSELAALKELPNRITAYRAPRPGEQDWISYTLSLDTASLFALKRRSVEIVRYQIRKGDVLALFLRRGESELIVLDGAAPKLIESMTCVYTNSEQYKELLEGSDRHETSGL